MEEFLKNFEGHPIPDTEIANGMHLSFKNAQNLFDEAILLKENKHYARALSLLILCLEELGKTAMLLNAVMYKHQEKGWDKFWKEYRSHVKKLGVWSIYGSFMNTIELEAYSDRYPVGLVPFLNKIKQLGFYVSNYDGRFLAPDEFASDNLEWLEWLEQLATYRLKRFEKLHDSPKGSEKLVAQANDMIDMAIDSKSQEEFSNKFEQWYEKLRELKKNGT